MTRLVPNGLLELIYLVQIFAGVLYTLDIDPLANLVAPSFTAATGVVPISIVSVIPDIVKHHADVIVTAEKDVFLATNLCVSMLSSVCISASKEGILTNLNSWERSASSRVICDALRELSKRAGERKSRVVVKIMYDRGNIKQVCHFAWISFSYVCHQLNTSISSSYNRIRSSSRRTILAQQSKYLIPMKYQVRPAPNVPVSIVI